MAKKITGITVEINGNTTKLNKALNDTNKEIKGTQSALKQVERLLKLDPSNTELLSQKQTLLAKSVTETKNKLNLLKEAEKQVQQQMSEGKVSQDQYDALRRKIISTEISLDGLEKEAKQTNDALEQSTQKSATGFKGLISKIKSSASTASESAKGGFTILKGTLANLASAGIQKCISGLKTLGSKITTLGLKADDLNTLSNQTGISTADIQKMEYAADVVDVSVDDITGALRKMKKNMTSTSSDTVAAWEKLGIAVTDGSGHARNSTTVFYETLQALSKVTNETERDQLAMQLFGKSADNLAGIVDDGGAALRSLGDEAERAGVIMSQDALDSANKFNDSVDRLKATATGTFNQIGAAVAGELAPKLEEVANNVQEFLKSPEGQAFVDNLSQLIATIIDIVGQVIEFCINNKEVVLTILAVITAAVIAFNVAQLAANAAIWACPITWIIAAIAALVVAIVAIIANWDTVCAALKAGWDAICNGISAAIDWIKGVFSAIVGWINDNIIQPIGGFFKGLWDGICNGVKTAIDWISNALKKVANFFIGIANGAISAAEWLVNAVISLVNMGIGKINDMLKGISSVLSFVGINVDWQVPEIPKVQYGRIPYLAKGGKLKGSAIVGEAGPELLTNNGGRTTVTPLTSSERAAPFESGTTINVNFDTFNNFDSEKDMTTLADMIGDKLSAKARRGALI